jgi:hypothetical protein
MTNEQSKTFQSSHPNDPTQTLFGPPKGSCNISLESPYKAHPKSSTRSRKFTSLVNKIF